MRKSVGHLHISMVKNMGKTSKEMATKKNNPLRYKMETSWGFYQTSKFEIEWEYIYIYIIKYIYIVGM